MADHLSITCISSGQSALLVDHGREGQRKQGIARGGAADRRAAGRVHEILQLPPQTPLLEFTFTGGQWLINGKGQICLGGADMNWKLNGRPTEAYTIIDLDGDYLLDGDFARRGCRAYLGIRGQWQLPLQLGSVSPGLPGQTVIKKGWSTNTITLPELDYYSDLDPYQHCPALPYSFKVIPGPEWHWLTPDEQQSLLANHYTIGRESNRQGVRLETNPATATLNFATLKFPSLISSPVLPATIQLTQSGPILLGCDAQTLGGFPRILLLAKDADLDVAGQLKPGDEVRIAIES